MNKEFLNFQQNLKKTSFGVRFGKTLLTEPERLNPANVTQALRMLGLNIPKEVVIAQDLAQCVITGSSISDAYTAYETVSSAQNLNSLCNVSGLGVNTLTNIARRNSWMDATTSSELSIGGYSLRIMASGGLDVFSWLGLAIEMCNANSMAQAAVDAMAKRGNIEAYQSYISNQSKKLTEHLTELNSGSIGLFGFLAKSAQDSPALFGDAVIKNKALSERLPGLKFLPIFTGVITTTASQKTWWGETKTSTSSQTYQTIGDMTGFTDSQVKEYIFAKVIEPFTVQYLIADQYYRTQGQASLFEAGALATVNGEGSFDVGKNFAKQFFLNRLVPSDVGDTDALQNYQVKQQEVGVSFSSGKTLQAKASYTKEEILDFEMKGDIKKLLENPDILKFLSNRYTFNYFPNVDTEAKLDWRKVENLISCLDFLDLVKTDPYYQSGARIDRIEQYQGFWHLENWKTTTADAYNISTVRRVNENARQNVAYFLQTSVNKLVMKQDYEPGQPAKFV